MCFVTKIFKEIGNLLKKIMYLHPHELTELKIKNWKRNDQDAFITINELKENETIKMDAITQENDGRTNKKCSRRWWCYTEMMKARYENHSIDEEENVLIVFVCALVYLCFTIYS